MTEEPYQLQGVTREVLESLLEGVAIIHEGVDSIYVPHVIFSASLEYQRARFVDESYDLDSEIETGQHLIDEGILEVGFDDESQVRPVIFRILDETADIEVFLYQVSRSMDFDDNFGPKHLAFMAEIVRQSRTIFGGGNALSNLISGNATFDYVIERSNAGCQEIFDDPSMVSFMKTIRGEIAHNPWGLHDGGQIEPFDMNDVYLGTLVLHKLYNELGHAIYGNAITKVVDLEPFNYDLDKIRDAQDSLGWVYREESDGWNKTNFDGQE